MNGFYQLGLYEKATPADISWEERLAEIAQAGFDSMEISIDETEARLARLDWSAQKKQELLRAQTDTGLPIRSMCLSAHRKYAIGSTDDAVRARGMEIMRKALEFASDMGIRLIQLAGYDAFYEPSTAETEKRFRESLARCVEMAAVYGVMLGFETMDTPFMNTTAKAMHYVQAMNSGWLGVYPDLGNLTNAAVLYQDSVIRDLRTGTGHLLAMHMKETVPGRDRGIPFGSGHVDFIAGAKEAWRLGIRRFVAECWDDGSGAWRMIIRNVNAFVRKAIDMAADIH